jgi:ribose transport system permease protein
MEMKRRRINLGFDRFSGFYLWALFIIIYGYWEPQLFLSMATFHSVASEYAISGLVGLAVLVPLIGGAFDLSVGATVNLSAIIAIQLQVSNGWNMWIAIAIAIGAALLIGVVNGFIVVKLQVSSFIATLGMATVVAAVQYIVTGGGQPSSPTSTLWANLTQHTILGFQAIIFYLIVIAFIFWWALELTPAGRYLYAVGGNIEAARLSGVKVGKWTWLSLITSAGLSGVAGVLYASLSGPSLTFGVSLLLPAFAAVFLGSTQLKPGRANVWGTLLAIYVLATGVRGLQLATGAQWLNDMFNGVALIVAVSFAGWRQRAAATNRLRPGSPGPEEESPPPDPVTSGGATTDVTGAEPAV